MDTRHRQTARQQGPSLMQADTAEAEHGGDPIPGSTIMSEEDAPEAGAQGDAVSKSGATPGIRPHVPRSCIKELKRGMIPGC